MQTGATTILLKVCVLKNLIVLETKYCFYFIVRWNLCYGLPFVSDNFTGFAIPDNELVYPVTHMLLKALKGNLKRVYT